MHIPFLSLAGQHEAIKAKVLAAMTEVYDRQWFILGEQVAAFEREYSLANRVAYTVGVGNGLDALHLSMRALGIRPGDEVLVPSNTYIATWLAVTMAGGVPVPIEPNWQTSNMDPAQLAAAVTSRTRGIIPVHLYGQPCEMSTIMDVAAYHGLWVVEDNAQAQSASWQGQLTGSFGRVNATSFYPSKNLGALGDGGAVTTNDKVLVHAVRQLRNYGTERRYVSETIGYNSRLDELQAAVLRVKLHYLNEWTQQRRELAAWYSEDLADIPGLRLPFVADGAVSVWHLYVVHTSRRNALQQYLAAVGIETVVHYPIPPHLQPAYAARGLFVGALPIAEELAATCLSLPLWPGMTRDMVSVVVKAIKEFFDQ
jgi:dTDP-4-amino-4,6-dideoxygalactose transaminase